MASTQNVVVAAVAGVVVLGGAAWLMQDKFMSSGIHSVDFRNTPVEVVGTACADPQLTNAGVTKLPLHDGTYQLGQYQFELVGDVRFGDVSGHTGETGSDKAVFVGSCSTAGKTSQVLFVYGMEDGKPERVASTDLSGTANTLVQSYTVGDGSIQIKANQGDPPALVTLTYALLNGALVNLNPAATTPPAATQPAPEAAPAEPQAPAQVIDASVGEDQVNFDTFHNELAPYGQWINHPQWGLVWHPTAVPADFRPYREGHWEDTDEYGTVWVSDYSWGDVPFHYGRWGYDPQQGWLWQPGYTWSPAWVAWREGDGDIGWFPIPPGYYNGTGVFVDGWDDWYGYRALYAAMDAAAFYGLWSFIPADDIYAPGIAVDVIAPGLYAGFIGRTRDWTRFGTLRGHLFNHAIDRDRFRVAFGHPLPAGGRHDFLDHHGPIVGVDKGRVIASHEHVSMGVGHGVSVHAGVGHYGPASHGASSYGHSYSHTSYGHSFAGEHSTSHGSVSAHSGFGGSSEHSGFGRASEHSGFGGTSAHSGFGGSEHSSFGGGSSHSSFGGGSSHSAFGGGAPAQHSFGGGAYAQRPASGGGFGSAGGGAYGHSAPPSAPHAAPPSAPHHH